MKIDINPQEILALTEQILGQGWVKGKLSGFGTIDEDGQKQETAFGHCIYGAVEKAVAMVVEPSIVKYLSEEVPEVIVLPPAFRQKFLKLQTTNVVRGIQTVFKRRLDAAVKAEASNIPSWNDNPVRQKTEVLALVRRVLEEVTQECLLAWEMDEMAKELATSPDFVTADLVPVEIKTARMHS